VGSDKDGDVKNPGVIGLALSMEAAGQDQPIDVAVLPEGPDKGQLHVMEGFRRTLAVEWLASQDPPRAIKGLLPGQIKVKVFDDLSMKEIRAHNLRGTVRENMVPADLAYGIQEYLRIDPSVKSKDIAEMMGKSEPYVSTLRTIAEGLDPVLFQDWRESNAPLSKGEVYRIAKLDKKEQKAAYAESVKKNAPAEPGETDANAWIDAAKDRARRFGFQIGTLKRVGLIKFVGWDPEDNADANFLDPELARDLLKLKQTITKGTGADKKQKAVSVTVHRAIAKVVNQGINEGLQDPKVEEEEDEDGEEEVEAAPAKKTPAAKKAGKKGNSAEAAVP
jgi:hypothetical protein